MPRARTNGIEIEYELHGDEGARPLLLVRGLGTQLIQWPPDFLRRLLDSGHRLVLFDNRDVGLSTHLSQSGVPSLREAARAVAEGRLPDVPYTLSDMAHDVAGLMDALGLASAHVAGISMGGMIGQQLAIRQPGRVRSLVSIMSTTGEPGLPGPTPAAAEVLMSAPPQERSAWIDHHVRTQRVIGSPGFGFDEGEQRQLAGRVYDRAFDPSGVARQLAAVTASGSRLAGLQTLRVPSLVVHGDSDPLIPLACGRATAAAIPNAELLVVAGMGHDLPAGAFDLLSHAISRHTAAAEASSEVASAGDRD